MPAASSGQTEGELIYDNRLQAYLTFFDHDWANRLLGLTHGTAISQASFDLCTDWKGTANAFRMPWLMIFCMENLVKGFMQTHEPFWRRLTKAFRQYILDRVRSGLSQTKKKELIRIIDHLSEQVQEEMKQAGEPFSVDQAWAEFLTSPEFVLSLWSTQRLCYAAVYHAYENFLRRCVAVGKQDDAYRPRNAEVLKGDLDRHVVSGMGALCLGDSEVVTARLVRNSLAHNGGRATAEIVARQRTLTVKNGLIHIMPDDVRRLFGLLKDKVLSLVLAADALSRAPL